MKPHLSLVTLGVEDLARAVAFYRDGLGWPVRFENESVVFLQLNGLLLSLYGKRDLAEDIGTDSDGTGFHRFTLAHNVSSRAAVDAVMRDAEAAGARIIKPAAEAFWGGYSGYFADPDGFYWEVAHNPDMPDLAADHDRETT